jgi:hypothetical protein
LVISGLFLALASAASAASPSFLPIATTGPTVLPPVQSEVQRLGVDAEEGTYTLSFKGEETEAVAFDASAAEVEAALNALSTVEGAGGRVTVKGGPGDKGGANPYFIDFEEALAGIDVPEITADSSNLGGGTHTAFIVTTVPGGPGTTTLAIYAQNTGGASTSGQITVSVQLPEGVTTSATPGNAPFEQSGSWTCTPGAGQSAFTCTTSEVVDPSLTPKAIDAPLVAGPEAGGTRDIEISFEGGGAQPASYELPLTVSSTPAAPGFQSLVAGAFDEDGNLDSRAGAHPYSAMASMMINTTRSLKGEVVPVGEFKDIAADLPPGFLGNPVATPRCPESAGECLLDTIVGISQPLINKFGGTGFTAPIFNIQAPFGYPGKFKFIILNEEINAVGGLRSDEDYGLSVTSFNTPQILTVYGFFFTFWGAPASPAHDAQRCENVENHHGCGSSDAPNTAFLTNATNCAEQALSPPVTTLVTNTWQEPLRVFSRDVAIPPVTECDQLHFESDFTFEPSDTRSDSPASFRTELAIPSEGLTDPSKRTVPEIKETVVQLPEGATLNPSGADGLAACSEAQIGLKNKLDPVSGLPIPEPLPNRLRFRKDPNTCPEDSKICSGELKSALLENPLHGALYLAAQGKGNPFGSLFAVYLVIEDPSVGVFIKLPGEVEADKGTGRLQVSFRDLPQLPFTYLRLNLKGGNRSALASPTTCGTFTTTATNTPWSAPESGPPSVSENGFQINQGPDGGPCAQTKAARPFDVGFNAGTAGVGAGDFSPLSFRITRPDGSQELSALDLTTAPGLSAKLAGIARCSDGAISTAEAKTGRAEQASPSCPPASQIGKVVVGAGAGPTPFYSEGKLYLAGPYKGAPLSVVAITPAVAGPFDLGSVVVRTAAFLNRSTAQVTAKSDPIPQILEGVPLRIRDVRIMLDRSEFALNPTSCEPTSIAAHLTGNSGASKDLSSRFQVGGCEKLAFKPSFSAKVKGGTERGDHPQFIANVSWPEGQGYANTKDVQVTLPHSEFLDQAHIRTICTRVQALADACPPGSIYGIAEAETPLLDGKLTGPVFLKSSDHKLPDLAIKLRGPDSMPVEVEFAGRINSIKGQIRNTIENLPDVPVSHFTLRMKGGDKGLLINSRNLCTTRKVHLDVSAVGQNNSIAHLRPALRNSCKQKRHRGRR